MLFGCEELCYLAATDCLGDMMELASKKVIIGLHVGVDEPQWETSTCLLEFHAKPAFCHQRIKAAAFQKWIEPSVS